MADAVVLPGGSSGPKIPLLWYAAEVAARRGATVHRHDWKSRLPMPWGPHIEKWVGDEAAEPLRAAGERPLLIGKSLGTLAAGVAADRDLPAVWFTPLLTEPWAVEALSRATAPFLLIGGTADHRWWDGAVARRLSPYVLEVEGAGHGLELPGPVSDEVAVLGRMVVAVTEFLDAINWPA